MNRRQYKAITDGGTGSAVRNVLNGMVVQAGSLAPTRSQLRAQIDAIPGLDDASRAALWDRALALHQRAQESGAVHFKLRQQADLEAVEVVEQMQRADRLIDDGSEVLHPDPGADHQTADAVADAIASLSGRTDMPAGDPQLKGTKV